MLSRVIPLEYLKERDLMFWLPPGGQDNEVWADTWVILADLESADAEPVLAALRDADVGAYVATPSGRKGAVSSSVQLYVDREQHNKAVDLLMLFLRGKEQPVLPRAERIAPKLRSKVPAVPRAVSIALQVAFMAGLLALGVLLAYYRGPSLFPAVHHTPQPPPISDVPALQRP